ncbi:hypothetical protein P3T23_003633 [Paraburkholderia sp. GAS448]
MNTDPKRGTLSNFSAVQDASRRRTVRKARPTANRRVFRGLTFRGFFS